MVNFEINMVELCIKWNEIIHSSDIFLKNLTEFKIRDFFQLRS